MFAGPAAYEPKVHALQNKGGKMVHKEKRFMEVIKEDVPGPGTYEVNKSVIMSIWVMSLSVCQIIKILPVLVEKLEFINGSRPWLLDATRIQASSPW